MPHRLLTSRHAPLLTHAALVGLTDALFALLCLANSLDIDLQAAWDATLEKYRVRDETT